MASSRSRKRHPRPNIFVADRDIEAEEPRGAAPAPTPVEPPPSEATSSPPVATRPARSTPAFRAARGQPVRSRSEVFTHYLPQELRKLGILSGLMLVVLILLAVFMR